MMIKNITTCLIGIIILLAGCSVGSNGPSSTQNSTTSSTNIQISNVTTVPTANYTSGEYTTVAITNNSDKNVTLQNSNINANGKTLPASAITSYIDLGKCIQIASHATCNAKIFTNPTFQSYLLGLIYTDNSGISYNVNQVISFNALLPTQNGFIYDATQLSINNSGLAIPFRLAGNYSNISVLINDTPAEFSCYGNNYKVNTLCSANINSHNLPASSSSNTSIKIIGYGSDAKPITNTILVLTNTQAASLITSGQNVVINPDDGTNPQTVYLVNNGLTAATGITITPANPVTVTSSTCGTSLNAGANCSFVINVSGSPTSGQSSVAVSYSNGQTSQILFFNVSYINAAGAALTLTQSGYFSNIATNSGPRFMSVNVSNTGASNLTNLQFSNLNLQKSNISSFAVGSSCYNGVNLNSGQSCSMMISYSPTAAESGTVNFIPIASYLASGGESRTYTNSILTIPYSAVVIPTFVALGDYGTVISSTNNPPTWTANINSPFVTAAESATGITINNVGGNNVYVIMKNTGQVESSTQNGLFWRIAGTTNYSASTCGIVFDGTTYYTCGTANATVAPCTINVGCIESSTTLATWTRAFRPAQAVLFNNIYYYTNGTNRAYIATVANATINTGIAASTNGITFSAPTSTGLAAANSNLLGTAFNTVTNTIAAWATTGFSTSVAIASITGTWTNGGTAAGNRPATSQVRAAIFQNGIYTTTTSAGNIYTSTANAGPYTSVYTGTTQINGIAYGNGTYLAAGNNSIAIESATGGVWTAMGNFFSPSNLLAAYFESVVTNKFWVTGVGVIGYTPTASPPSWQTPNFNNAVKNGTTYLAVDRMGGIFSSTNLTSWTTLTNPTGKTLFHLACPQLNLCFAVGESGIILKTTNGTTWVQQTSPVPTNVILHDINCNFNTCITVGGSGAASSGTVATTNDFINWTLQTSTLATTSFIAVTYYNNLFITSGVGGITYISANNGITWQQVSLGTTNDVYSLDCGNNIGCVGVGNAGNIVFSPNGIIWSVQTIGTSVLTCVAYNGIFVVVGNNGTLLYSTNGTTWNTSTFPATSSPVTSITTVIAN